MKMKTTLGTAVSKGIFKGGAKLYTLTMILELTPEEHDLISRIGEMGSSVGVPILEPGDPAKPLHGTHFSALLTGYKWTDPLILRLQMMEKDVLESCRAILNYCYTADRYELGHEKLYDISSEGFELT